MLVKRRRLVAWIVGLCLLMPLVGLFMMSFFAGRPDNLGVTEGRLAPCPDKPNCVSTQADDPRHAMSPIPWEGSADRAIEALQRVVQGQPRATIVTTGDNYLHAEFRSLLFRFPDDVEFFVDEQQGLIHFRSASRVGYSDMGVNRQRMEKICDELFAALSSDKSP